MVSMLFTLACFVLVNWCQSEQLTEKWSRVGEIADITDDELNSALTELHDNGLSSISDVARYRQKRGLLSYFQIRSHVKGLGMYLIPMDVVCFLKNQRWDCKIEGLAYVLDMGQRSLTDNLYYYGKLLVLMTYTLKDIAYLLEAMPIKEGGVVIVNKATETGTDERINLKIHDDGYFTQDLIFSVKGMEGMLAGGVDKIEMSMNSTTGRALLFAIPPLGTAIMVMWGDATFSKNGKWEMIKNDQEMVRTYEGPNWLPNAYRTLQAKYNAFLFYVCAQPMQLHGSIKHYLATKNFPTITVHKREGLFFRGSKTKDPPYPQVCPRDYFCLYPIFDGGSDIITSFTLCESLSHNGALFMIRHFYLRLDDVLEHTTTVQDRWFFLSKTIERVMISAPLRKFIFVGSSADDIEVFTELYRAYNKRIRHIFLYNSFRETRTSSRFNPFKQVIEDDRWTLFNATEHLTKEIKDIYVDDSIKQGIFSEKDNIESEERVTRPKSRLFLILACLFAALCLIPLFLVVLYWYGMLDHLAGRQTYAQRAYSRMSSTKDAFVRQSSVLLKRASKLLRRSDEDFDED